MNIEIAKKYNVDIYIHAHSWSTFYWHGQECGIFDCYILRY